MHMLETNVCLVGDALEQLATLPDECAQTCVTSPPYWGLRDYGVSGQLGCEPTPDEYVSNLVAVFREVRRVLRDDGTLWLNLGDSYAGSWGNQGRKAERGTQRPINGPMQTKVHDGRYPSKQSNTGKVPPGLKPKDLVGIPWRVAFALQADGWWLRSDIIWAKPNPTPSSVVDRPTTAHEYVFLLSKSARYYYDADAIAEPSANAGKVIPLGDKSMSKGQAKGSGKQPAGNALADSWTVKATRNKRSVWTVATGGYSEAHFATMPIKLAKTMVLAGSKKGDVVLDPFMGSGTTAYAAQELGRRWLGVELNEDYIDMQKKRTAQQVLL